MMNRLATACSDSGELAFGVIIGIAFAAIVLGLIFCWLWKLGGKF